ncbi:putative sporulation protein YtaF [Clostridium cavendishii DSM 21758]|uniref:Putative sporulation protein YtaF n=1 Tax=Clostridium cavendishii DSM 21758 TaxID=1121302 RepID=A0A1M6B9F7_9CLOT|nr:sporulation membrane protein YtaF [Clostridium cavendishii]SHI45369.1 putative sporulation protein YtaF [Clostridium cavendishii DSM 21758]
MALISIILFVLSASIDNFTVAVAYGIKKIKIDLTSNLIIALVSAIGTFIAMTLGKTITNFIPSFYASALGSFILIFIGLYFLYDYFKNIKPSLNIAKKDVNNVSPKEILNTPEIADLDKSGNIDIKESIGLSIALALNNFGLGIGAGISGFNCYLTSSITFIFSILVIPFGVYIAKNFISSLAQKYSSLISAFIIIFLGVLQVFF